MGNVGSRNHDKARQDAVPSSGPSNHSTTQVPLPAPTRTKAPLWRPPNKAGDIPNTGERPPRSDQPGVADHRKTAENHGSRDASRNTNPLFTVPGPSGDAQKPSDRGFQQTEDLRQGRGETRPHRPSMKIISNNPPKAAESELNKTTQQRYPNMVRSAQSDHLTKGAVAKELRLDEQYRLSEKGDVARQLGLDKGLREAKDDIRVHRRPKEGHPAAALQEPRPDLRDSHDDHRDGPHNRHRHFHHHGPVHADFANFCFHINYYGPGYYPDRCWYPHWSPWVAWSWHYRCQPIWDPRPVWCRPVLYVVAPAWSYWEVPVWTPLPVVACGTWVDVPPPLVNRQYDLQLLAVRFVDPGHPEENLGPRYRVWFRNNSNEPITRPFNVTLLASADDRLQAELPQAGARVTTIGAGDIQSVDIRLPADVNTMPFGNAGNRVPFNMLHVLVDANREINETTRNNNGVKIARADVLPVDPAAFEVQPKEAAVGSEVLLAGEGLGPEPGQVLIHLGGIEMQGEIVGWYDLGVRLSLPNLPLAGPAEAELIIIRGDGAAANPLKLTLTPAMAGAPIIGPALEVK